VRFAIAQKLIPKLDFPVGQRGGPSSPGITEDPIKLAHRLLHDPELSARDRVASVLIAIFAQPVSRVARLTADEVTLNADRVTIRFGDTAVSLPEPVAAMSASCWTNSLNGRPGWSGTLSGCSPAPWRRARSASWSSAGG
jgi:hypothetical protein